MKKKWIPILLVIGLLPSISVRENTLRGLGRPMGCGRSACGEGSGSSRFLFGYLLGGLRAPVVGLSWLKVNLNYRKGRYFVLAKEFRTLAGLNPYSERVWDYAAWHMAFNVSRRAAEEEDRFRYQHEGLRLAREGLSYLPLNRTLLLRVGILCQEMAGEHRSRFLEVEGRHPEAVAYEAYGRLLERPDVLTEDLPQFADVALDWGVRLLRLGRPDPARQIMGKGIQALKLYRSLALVQDPAGERNEAVEATLHAAETWHEAASHMAAARRLHGEGKADRARTRTGKALELIVKFQNRTDEVADYWKEDACAVIRAIRRRRIQDGEEK